MRGRTAAIGALIALVVCSTLPGSPWLPAMLATPLLLSGVVLGLALGVSVATRANAHAKLAKQLRRTSSPVMGAPHVRELAGVEGALVAGLVRPTIYCSPTLRHRLTPDEFRAVLLHERHHQRSHAPARLVVLEAIAALTVLDAGRRWLARRIAALEVAADSYAIERGAPRSALAGALIKLAFTSPAAGIGFTSAVELRVRALLDPPRQPQPTWAWSWQFVAPTFVALCLMLRMP